MQGSKGVCTFVCVQTLPMYAGIKYIWSKESVSDRQSNYFISATTFEMLIFDQISSIIVF